jgi:hypothetical protein
LCDAIAKAKKKKAKKPTWSSFRDNVLLLGWLELVIITQRVISRNKSNQTALVDGVIFLENGKICAAHIICLLCQA